MQYKLKCKRCGYKWDAHLRKPKACPNCKRYDWDKDNVKKRAE